MGKATQLAAERAEEAADRQRSAIAGTALVVSTESDRMIGTGRKMEESFAETADNISRHWDTLQVSQRLIAEETKRQTEGMSKYWRGYEESVAETQERMTENVRLFLEDAEAGRDRSLDRLRENLDETNILWKQSGAEMEDVVKLWAATTGISIDDVLDKMDDLNVDTTNVKETLATFTAHTGLNFLAMAETIEDATGKAGTALAGLETLAAGPGGIPAGTTVGAKIKKIVEDAGLKFTPQSGEPSDYWGEIMGGDRFDAPGVLAGMPAFPATREPESFAARTKGWAGEKKIQLERALRDIEVGAWAHTGFEQRIISIAPWTLEAQAAQRSISRRAEEAERAMDPRDLMGVGQAKRILELSSPPNNLATTMEEIQRRWNISDESIRSVQGFAQTWNPVEAANMAVLAKRFGWSGTEDFTEWRKANEQEFNAFLDKGFPRNQLAQEMWAIGRAVADRAELAGRELIGITNRFEIGAADAVNIARVRLGLADPSILRGVERFEGIAGLAHGGMIRRGGMALVGERGPELVSLPGGAFVHPSGTGPGGGLTNNFIFNGAVYGVDDLREVVVEAVRDHALSGGFSGVFGEP